MDEQTPFLQIGDVLNMLKDDFPDVTVTKIRYLEGEGLINPERATSGYRKFTQTDVDRLRFILKMQRDQFMPLRVIRTRLEEWPQELTVQETVPQQIIPVVDEFTALPETGLSLSREEFCKVSSLSQEQIGQLESYGLITGRPTSTGEDRYDEVALQVAKLSAKLIDLGLEARHLRMFSSTVDRWTSMAEQMVLPLQKQKNPEARAVASQTVRELVVTGQRLMQILLREELGEYLS